MDKKINYTITPYPHPLIAKEGWPFIAISLIITVLLICYAPFWLYFIFVLLSIFIIQFFRDPRRITIVDQDIISSPADGKIVSIEQCLDEYQNITAKKVSIFMNVFNVHSNRSPVDGEVLKIAYFPGKFFNADLDKSSKENERNAVIMKTANGTTITMVQIAGFIARRILCYTKVGDILHKGQRYGFIRFGSRVDLYLPLDAEIMVQLGDKVAASETPIARLPAKTEQNKAKSKEKAVKNETPIALITSNADHA